MTVELYTLQLFVGRLGSLQVVSVFFLSKVNNTPEINIKYHGIGEVKEALKAIKNGKAPGADRITAEMMS